MDKSRSFIDKKNFDNDSQKHIQGVFKTRIDSRSGIESIQIQICMLKIAIEINFLDPIQTSFELKNG